MNNRISAIGTKIEHGNATDSEMLEYAVETYRTQRNPHNTYSQECRRIAADRSNALEYFGLLQSTRRAAGK